MPTKRRSRRSRRNPAWHEHQSLYAPTIHGKVAVQRPKRVGRPEGSVRIVKTKIIRVQNPTDPYDAEELLLFAMNDGGLYTRIRRPVEQRALRAYAEGNYSSARAYPMWHRFVQAAAVEYRRQIDRDATFSPAVRKEAATEAMRIWEAEMPHALKYLDPPRGRKNPRRGRRY